jgi:DNA-binding CsgD family transcriptional regulator
LEKHLSCRAIIPILQYVENHQIELDLFLKGFPVNQRYLKNPRNWVSRDFCVEIFNRCEQSFHDPFIMYAIGKEYWLPQKGSFLAFISLLYSPSLFIKFLPRIVSFVSKFFFIRSEMIGRNEARITVSFKDKQLAHRHGCLYNLGCLVGFFHYIGKTKAWVKEERCICNDELTNIIDLRRKPREVSSILFGRRECIYHVRWLEPKMAPYMKDFLNDNEELLNQALLALENDELTLQEKEEELQHIELEYERQRKQDIVAKYRLSKREQQIVLYVACGKTNRQISEHLFISIDTVKKHLYNIFQKTGIKSRTELAALFYQNSVPVIDKN